jgi:outer membrane protein assembly factor BamB
MFKRGLGLSILFTAATIAWAVPDFSFVQMSDIHMPYQQSQDAVSSLRNTRGMEMDPYGIKMGTTSFVMITGDITEFGEAGWSSVESLFKRIDSPIFLVLGNHDNTWSSNRDKMYKLYGKPYYSFNENGCHFIMLESPMVQDPMPGFGEEQLAWLKQDLAGMNPETPIFLAMHHPLDSNEYASPYERYQLLELFQPYNLVCVFVGHGHSARRHNFEGYDGIQGGSPVKGGPGPGYNLVTISGDTLYIDYRLTEETTAHYPLLRKPLTRKHYYPQIKLETPKEEELIRGDKLSLKATVYRFPGSIMTPEFDVDGGKLTPLKNTGTQFEGDYSLEKMNNGVHYLRILMTGSQFTAYHTQLFYYENMEGPKALWRHKFPASFRSSPVYLNGTLYLADMEGNVYAVSTAKGNILWTFKTDGEILGTPLISEGKLYIGSGDGNFYCLSTSGEYKWKFQADAPIYSTPCLDDAYAYFGSKKGTVYAVNIDNGKLKWKNSDPQYTIESKLALLNSKVYVTAWDSYVYAINAATGKLAWKSTAAGSTIRPVAKQYYSAADSNVWIGRNQQLYVSDRDWYLSQLQPDTGTLGWYTTNTLSISLGDGNKYLYSRNLRGDAGELQKWTLDGENLWTANVKLNMMGQGRALRYTISPLEKDGKVYAVSCWGTLYCVDDETGKELWQYQLTPQLPVLAVPAVDESGIVYAAAMDGTLTAVKGNVPSK